jgi:hypothetical protein
MRAPIGFRIRNQRKSLDISQANLARIIGISPSYLNLIEASKRDVGGILLQNIAKALELNIDQLTGENEQRLINDIGGVFLDPMLSKIKLAPNDIQELVVQSPKVASALVQLYRAYIESNASIELFTSRLKADPLFSQLLHQVLSQVTAIRSNAEILAAVTDLSIKEREGFLASIEHESLLMAEVAQTLIAHFDQTSLLRKSITPTKELDDLIIEEKNYFPLLEDAALVLRKEVLEKGNFGEEALLKRLESKFSIKLNKGKNIKNINLQFCYDDKLKAIYFSNSARASTKLFQLAKLYAKLSLSELLEAQANDERLISQEAKKLAFSYLAGYVAGAMIFPYDEFLKDAKENSYDIDYLGQKYIASFEQVAHRLVTLRQKGASGIAFGFLRADPAGRLTKHFPLPGLLLPNSGHACPLWAIYYAFQSNSQIVRQIVRFADGSRYLFIAKTSTKKLTAFNDMQLYSSVMLACEISYAKNIIYGEGLNLKDEKNDILVGPSCRLCTFKDCAHRQEEAFYPT